MAHRGRELRANAMGNSCSSRPEEDPAREATTLSPKVAELVPAVEQARVALDSFERVQSRAIGSCDGWLYKQRGTTGPKLVHVLPVARKKWQRRWFELDSAAAQLRYFEDADLEVCKGTLQLSQCASVQWEDGESPQWAAAQAALRHESASARLLMLEMRDDVRRCHVLWPPRLGIFGAGILANHNDTT